MNPHTVPVFSYTPIGTIHSPFTEPAGMPIQPAGAAGVRGTIVIGKKFRGGLRDLSDFSRVILIYAFHRSQGYELEVIPFLDTVPHGIFATRSPRRPNAIGISIVRLISVNDGELVIEGVDVVDGTPLLDIKPYVPEFDCHPDEKPGWFAGCGERVVSVRSDDRFCKER
ncbi:MAG: tRNA (N6-threonylcarbamoyladenosine(37)-N6)-methyltransferase TrmO [Methanoregula sp.]|jgi:tRNA-Thr(GGU) m(6)t(6)A37 methyltransferase TsaA|nr:tRNA (N6-threonylcarbamoyladenosine(37)-N6)-methyltransferase TrmO [Methanoregula sp.]